MFFGPPFSAGYAFRACRQARAKFAACAGLAIAVFEVLALVALTVFTAW